jgi:hypothetical protein
MWLQDVEFTDQQPETLAPVRTLFDFERKGHVAIRSVLSAAQVSELRSALLSHLERGLKDAYV